MTAERCPVCDRETCQREAMALAPLSGNIFPYFNAHNDCDAHRVDWRARALKVEAELQSFIEFTIMRVGHVKGSAQLGPTPSLQQDLQEVIDRGNDLWGEP